MNVLEVRDIHVSFEKDDVCIDVLKGISFDIEEHKTLALIGESGCGKTQTARCCLQLLSNNAIIKQGSVKWHGQDILQMNERELTKIRGKEIAMIFQQPQAMLNPLIPIGKQIQESMTSAKRSKKEIEKEVIELLEMVKIADAKRVIKAYPFQLSFGMCQRIMIAMAIASNAQLWIVDEATSALDSNVQADILDLLQELKMKRALSMLLIAHDLRILPRMSDQVAVMFDGEIVEIVDSKEIVNPHIAHHPYTQTLLDAMTYKESQTLKNKNIEILQCSCQYANRCRKCQPLCLSQKPEMCNVSKGQHIRCHFI